MKTLRFAEVYVKYVLKVMFVEGAPFSTRHVPRHFEAIASKLHFRN